jgi:formylmethanofuran dehydrogenase subunit E
MEAADPVATILVQARHRCGRQTKEKPMIDAKEFLKAAQHLHGHKCPAMPMGLRAGAAAMNALAVPRAKDQELVAILELGEDHCSHCFGDGVQMITGCTFGKGNLRTLPYGKFGLTLTEAATGRTVRVVPRAQVQAKMKQSRFFQEFRSKGVPASKVPDEVVEPMIQQVLGAPQDQLLSVGAESRAEVGKKVETFATRPCDACGEMVADQYLRVAGDQRVCIPCAASILGR